MYMYIILGPANLFCVRKWYLLQVLQRRQLGSVSYNRTWEAFKNGFGFLGSEFWIGNDKIAFLTNQKHYQIRLEFENAAGLAFFITYDKFRISDEWGQYALFSIGAYSETGGKWVLHYIIAGRIYFTNYRSIVVIRYSIRGVKSHDIW